MTMMRRCLAPAALIGFVLFSAIPFTSAFATISSKNARPSALFMADGDNNDPFELMVTLPGKDRLQAQMKLKPVLDEPSEIIEVRYKVPFGLNVEPKKNLAVCTGDGPGGEKVGDILRFTSQWTMGLPRGNGAITTAASFSGAISWQVSMFDCCRASSWEELVEALTSNVEQRTDEVVLLFERPL